ncbi:MAG TPA: tetratricopeptide repeat protein [Burkholderiaceae bacterium]|jgi:tetratricopeptide (TPR) repeat protein
MSLLMQALKKAEHAKQKQSNSPSTDVAEEKNPLKIQNDEISPSHEEPSQPSSAVNLDMLDMELSPVATENTRSTDPEPAMSEPAYSTQVPVTNFNEPEPVTSNFDASYSSQNKTSDYQQSSQLDNNNRSDSEAVSQQLSAKMRLELQKAAAMESGKALAEQQKAKAVFTSKKPNANRRALWIVVGGIFVVTLFLGGGYYYLQLAPQNSTMLVKTLPIHDAPSPIPTPAVTPEATPVREANNGGAPVQTAALTQKSAEQPTAPPPMQIPQTASSKSGREQASVQRKRAPVSEAGAEAIDIRQTTTDSHINPALSKAYQFFMSGDLTAAQQQYQTVLQHEPNNHDALLGMAAIAISRKQDTQAGSFYLKLLELDPSDPDAIAGLTGLQGGDASEMESRLKKALAQNPQSGALMFTLGNLYAQQSRWSDAQQAYFRAYGAAPNNPDYAFNLAISLDRLDQKKLALEFYQRALTLAQNKPGNFNNVSIQDRINQLQSAPGS